ncbi:hypothetical protein [Maribacter sp. 4G9]|uniref:hypothetical protein n=1 Tax=Maribacter sp. 4G9 TaxID=1889777 RepID=UPI000C158B3C|nr:hypothetical protein [Maribacter sp. 4G9]PIB27879.1 hypothetical protein BFP75_06330 [Maribacter sp. 4G9]
MDPRIILGKILQRFSDKGFCQVSGYNKFKYLRENKNAVYVGREKGKDTRIGFGKVIIGIEALQLNPDLYNAGPNALRKFGITHVNSPVWSLLHLMAMEDYK